MSESLNHWVNWFVQKYWITQEPNNWLSLWVSHWIIELTDSFKNTESLRNQTMTTFMSESLNHWVNWFIQKTESLGMKQLSVFMSESLNHWVNWFVQKYRITQEPNNWVSLWVSHWIIELTDLFKNNESLRNQTTDCLYEWVTESLT